MDRLRPQELGRQRLQSFLGSDDLVRAFETYIRAITQDVPDELNDLRLDLSSAQAALAVVIEDLIGVRRDTEAAQIEALSAQVAQLREQITCSDEGMLLSVAAQVASLRESISTGAGMKIKRVLIDEITILNGMSEKNYTISPPLASMNAVLIFNGSWNTTGAFNAGAMQIISTTTINYKAGTNVTADLNGRFTLMEFE